jgi:predicted RNase H-like HicB family nuclease
MKKVVALIEKGVDGLFGVHAPELKNVIIGSGETVEEAKEDFLEGYREMVETYIDDGKPVPGELKDIEFDYRYDISAFYNAHPYLNVSKLAERLNINSSLMRQYKQGQYISEEQVLRIQDGIRSVGQELSSVTLVK